MAHDKSRPVTSNRKDARADTAETARRWLEEHGDALFRFALARLPGREQAEDAVQECLIAALSSRDSFRNEATERTWLFGILKHKLMDYYRHAGREVLLGDDADADALYLAFFDRNGSWREQPAAWHSPDSDIEREQFWSMLNHCIDGLPGSLGATMRMIEVDEQDSDEVCNALGISATNLWVRLHRARLKLRDCVERSWFRNGRRNAP